MLTLFPKYRALVAEHASLAASRITLQDRVRELDAEVSDLRAKLADAQRETVHSVQCVADWISQQTYGARIYGPAPVLPEKSQEPELINQRVQARKLCRQMEEEFDRKYELGDLA